MPIERIILLGFMGAGKSTVGRLISARLRWTFHDLDDLVEEAESSTVAQIFASRGETAFRRAECIALAAAVSARRIILSLGGGTLEDVGNTALVQSLPNTLRVHLRVPLAVAVQRCTADAAAAERPVLRDAEARFARRQPQYTDVADLELDTAEHTPEALAAKIVHAVMSASVAA